MEACEAGNRDLMRTLSELQAHNGSSEPLSFHMSTVSVHVGDVARIHL